MKRAREDLAAWFAVSWALTRALTRDLSRHWVMASFSIVAGFGVWFAIQDVENPRVEDIVPAATAQAVEVEAINVPPNYIFQSETVRVRVEAREQDIGDLAADDFEATVDLSSIDPSRESDVEVSVRSKKDGVRALAAVPSSIPVRLLPAETVEMQVVPRYTGSLPEGYRLLEDQVDVEPAFVNVTGTKEQIDAISTIALDVTLNGRRDATSVVEGELVARSTSGNTVTVKLDPGRAKVTLRIEQTFSQRTLPVVTSLTGTLPCCYRVAAVNPEPSTVLVTGPKNVVDNLTQVVTESIDITGATTNISPTRQIVSIPNTSMDRTTVVVRVSIQPIDCTATPSLCSATVRVAATLDPPPAGLAVVPGEVYYTDVVVSAPPNVLLKPDDFKATVSLVNATEGTALYPAQVSAPAGVQVQRASPVSVTLRSAP